MQEPIGEGRGALRRFVQSITFRRAQFLLRELLPEAHKGPEAPTRERVPKSDTVWLTAHSTFTEEAWPTNVTFHGPCPFAAATPVVTELPHGVMKSSP